MADVPVAKQGEGGTPSDRPPENRIAELERKLGQERQRAEQFASQVDELAARVEEINSPDYVSSLLQKALGVSQPQSDPVLQKLGPKPNSIEDPEGAAAWDRAYNRALVDADVSGLKEKVKEEVRNELRDEARSEEYNEHNLEAETDFLEAYKAYYRRPMTAAELKDFSQFVVRTRKGTGKLGSFTGQDLWSAWRERNADEFEARQYSEGQRAAVRNIRTAHEAALPSPSPSQSMNDEEFLSLPARDKVNLMAKLPEANGQAIYRNLPPDQQREVRREIHRRAEAVREQMLMNA